MNLIPRRYLFVLALLVTASGCAGSHVPVTGRLTWKGKPVPNTQVTFQPDDGSRPSKGLTDENGNFTLRYSRQQAGATRRRCTVFLIYVPSNDEETGKKPRAPRELTDMLRRYGDPKTSGLHYEIKNNKEHFDIDLE
jgi:hypothetical protein